MADGTFRPLAGRSAGHFRRSAEKGRGVHRGRRGRAQPPVRHRRHRRHHDRRGDVAVSSLCRHRRRLAVRDFPIIATQPLRYAHVAFVLVLSFLLFPMAMRFRNRIRWWDVVLGVVGAAILIYAIEGGDDFTDRATIADAARHRARRHLHRAAAGGDAAHHRPDRAGRRAVRSSPTPISGRICRSRGRIAASTSARSSAICSSRSKASSAFRSTCRRR